MKKEYIKPFAWGIAVGAIVLLIVIFSTGWVVTSGSAKTKAEEMPKNAVVGRLASICVEQSSRNPNKEERLKELKALDPWKRGEYAQKQG